MTPPPMRAVRREVGVRRQVDVGGRGHQLADGLRVDLRVVGLREADPEPEGHAGAAQFDDSHDVTGLYSLSVPRCESEG